MNQPLVSVIVPTKNSEKFLDKCLKSIKNQTYKNIEIIVVDGGSKDKTLEIAQAHKTTIINNPLILAEPGIYLGMQKAHGDLLMVLAVDNFFDDNKAIEKIINVFKNSDIYAVFHKHDSKLSYSIFAKYINTFTDPFSHFIYGDAANARTFKNIYNTIEHNKIYDVYDFQSAKIKPMLALAQGFTVRKEYTNFQRTDKFDDISPIFTMIDSGKKIAYIHSVSLYHDTVSDMKHFIRKQKWAAKNALEGKEYGISSRMHFFTRWQRIKIYLFPFYSLIFVVPLLRSIYRALKDNEKIWLFHPFISFISALAIIDEFIKIKLGLNKTFSRQ